MGSTGNAIVIVFVWALVITPLGIWKLCELLSTLFSHLRWLP